MNNKLLVHLHNKYILGPINELNEIKNIHVIGYDYTKVREGKYEEIDDKNIKYQFELIFSSWRNIHGNDRIGGPCNFLVITDMEFNVLESYQIISFK